VPAPTYLPLPAPSALPLPAPSALPLPAPTQLPVPAPSAVPLSLPTPVPVAIGGRRLSQQDGGRRLLSVGVVEASFDVVGSLAVLGYATAGAFQVRGLKMSSARFAPRRHFFCSLRASLE
jgi:hypothetical protein